MTNSFEKITFDSLFEISLRNGIYKSSEFQGRGIRIVNMGELFGYDFIDNQEMRLIELNENEKKKFLLKGGDLIFARRSVVADGAGKVSIIRNNLKDELTFESSIIRVRINKKLALPLYYYYYFKSQVGKEILSSITSGTNVKGIKGSDLKTRKVHLPPLPTQRKIAAILSAYDDLIENNLKRIQLLEEKAQLTYEEWFVRMKFPGHETTPVDEETGLPVGWEKKNIRDIIDVVIDNRGRNPEYYSDNGIPVIDNYLITNHPFLDFTKCNRYLDSHMYDTFIRKYLKPHDVLITLVGNGYGSVSIVPEEKCVIIQNTIGLRCNSLCSQQYLYSFLASSKRQVQNRNRGSAQPSVKVGDLLSIRVVIPDQATLSMFSDYITLIFKQVQTLAKQNQSLKEARDLLLPRLMTGVIDVDSLDVSILNKVNG